MSVDLRSSSLRGGRRSADDLDPMASLANLVDVMLVFACGLMMALVAAWDVDISSVTEVQTDSMTQVDTPEELDQEMTSANGTSYVDMGSVYMDPETGKYYMVEKDQEGDSSSSSTSSSEG